MDCTDKSSYLSHLLENLWFLRIAIEQGKPDLASQYASRIDSTLGVMREEERILGEVSEEEIIEGPTPLSDEADQIFKPVITNPMDKGATSDAFRKALSSLVRESLSCRVGIKG